MKPVPAEPELPASLRSILVVGGSFDPPHRAHLALAGYAARASGCDHTLFVPAARSPNKIALTASGADRLAMLRLALQDRAHVSVSRLELDRGPPSYTVHTLEALRESLDPQVTVHLFMGSDQAATLTTWHRWERILELAAPVVVLRPPDTVESIHAVLGDLVGSSCVIDAPPDDVSSTQIRARLAAGGTIADDQLDQLVTDYIRQHGLYR